MKFPIINQYYTVPQWLSDEAKDLAAYAIAQFMLIIYNFRKVFAKYLHSSKQISTFALSFL